MYLIIDKVGKLHHVNITHCNALVKALPRQSIKQSYLPVFRKAGILQLYFYLVFLCAVEYRSNNFESQYLRCPAKMGLEYLPDIHSRRDPQRVQNYLYRSSVFHIRQIFFRQYLGNNTLITVPAGHLIPDRQLLFARNVHNYSFQVSGRQFIPSLYLIYLMLLFVKNLLDTVIINLQCAPYFNLQLGICFYFYASDIAFFKLSYIFLPNRPSFCYQCSAGFFG